MNRRSFLRGFAGTIASVALAQGVVRKWFEPEVQVVETPLYHMPNPDYQKATHRMVFAFHNVLGFEWNDSGKKTFQYRIDDGEWKKEEVS